MKIPSSRPFYSNKESEAIERVLERRYTAEGPESRSLESELSEWIGTEYVTVASSGSTAWLLLLDALNIGEGDEVIVPSYTCQAVVNPIMFLDATPIVADVSPQTFGLTTETVQSHLSDRTQLILHVHPFGRPADSPQLYEFGLPVVEDVAQALGARTSDGEPVGARGIACIGSLYATKQVAAGYGGFVGTDDSELADELRDLKRYDERAEFRPAYNVSLSDLQSAIARVQLSRLEEEQKKRRKIAIDFDRVCETVEELDPVERPDGHVLYRYLVESTRAKSFTAFMSERGIEVKRPVHHPLHHDLPASPCPTSDRLHRELRLIPLLPEMSPKEVDYVVESIDQFGRQ